MLCRKCGSDSEKVIDTRTDYDLNVVRRRRVCLECGYRHTTYEISAEDLPENWQQPIRDKMPRLLDFLREEG